MRYTLAKSIVFPTLATIGALCCVSAQAQDILGRVVSSTAVINGGGRALATMIGLVGGAVVGNNVEGPRNQMQNVQQCSTQTSYENRTMHYDVVYEYADKRYSIQMPNDPGQYVRLQVTPVSAMPAPAPVQSYYQPYQQPGVIVGQPTTVYVQQSPVMIYPTPYPQPYYAPIGMSLNLGYGRGYGYGGGYRHWR